MSAIALKDVISSIRPSDVDRAFKPHSEGPIDVLFAFERPFFSPLAVIGAIADKLSIVKEADGFQVKALRLAGITSPDFIDEVVVGTRKNLVLDTGVVLAQARINTGGISGNGAHNELHLFAPPDHHSIDVLRFMTDDEAFHRSGLALSVGFDRTYRFRTFRFKTDDPKIINEVTGSTETSKPGLPVDYAFSVSFHTRPNRLRVTYPDRATYEELSGHPVAGDRSLRDTIENSMRQFGLPVKI